MHANQHRPTTTVIRSRFRSATEEPPTDDCMPPPNMSERPPPFPLCISTSSISRPLKTIRAIENPITTAGPTSSELGKGTGAGHLPDPRKGTTDRLRRSTSSLVAETDDLDELVRVQRGTADQGAVD